MKSLFFLCFLFSCSYTNKISSNEVIIFHRLYDIYKLYIPSMEYEKIISSKDIWSEDKRKKSNVGLGTVYLDNAKYLTKQEVIFSDNFGNIYIWNLEKKKLTKSINCPLTIFKKNPFVNTWVKIKLLNSKTVLCAFSKKIFLLNLEKKNLNY